MPHIGKRIWKSAVGVWLCYVIQKLRGGEGIVFYSQLAVLWCIQPYIKDSLKNGIQRTIGTLIGAGYGLLVIGVNLYVLPETIDDSDGYALLVSMGVLCVLYTTVIVKRKNTSYFSAVVFLSIVVNHIGDANPFIFVWNRVLDTMIGIVLGVCINMFRIPRKKRKDILFVSGIDDTLLDQKEKMSDYSRIELNRMLDEGAKFSVSTLRTPASVVDALGGIHWNLPMIVMDGAALYDMREQVYLKTIPLSAAMTEQLKQFFVLHEMNCFINVVIDNLLVISYSALQTQTEKQIYQELRKSPHRHFVNRDLTGDGDTLYFMAVSEEKYMQQVYEDLLRQTYYDQLKILYYPSTNYPGQMYLKIYHKDATKENMIKYLKKLTGLNKTVTFGSIEGKYDIIIHQNENDVVVHTLEKVYEPYWFLPE